MQALTTKPLMTALLAAGLGCSVLPAGAAEYKLIDLGSLGGNYERSFATGINASGQVVGYGYRNPSWEQGVSTSGDYQAFATGTDGQGITGLGMLDGGSWSKASAINDAGQVVGTAGHAAGGWNAFSSSWAQPGLSSLGTLGGANSSASAINASGQVVGVSTDAAGIDRAYITGANLGAMRALNTSLLGAAPPVQMSATGVTSSGQVAGSYSTNGYNQTGYITGPQGVAPHVLPGSQVPPGYDGWSPVQVVQGVNDEGQTVGHHRLNGASAFLKDADGADRPFDFSAAPHFLPGGRGGFGQYGPKTGSYALDVNASGQVVGNFVLYDYPGSSYAFITGEDGTGLVEVNSLDFVNVNGSVDFIFTSATGINDAGDFVVNANNGHAYLVALIPEPATVALLLAGLGWVGLVARRRMAGGLAAPGAHA